MSKIAIVLCQQEHSVSASMIWTLVILCQMQLLHLQEMWDGLGIIWEWTWYSQTVHAFTEPDLVGANAGSVCSNAQIAEVAAIVFEMCTDAHFVASHLII